ncbi:MAG: enoyl-CoA hydratase/isomerase family protein [Bacteroidia bacterium]|nr:enoyl-CoA hydratase/isomerase family protein [Bacteroidia bacterium]
MSYQDILVNKSGPIVRVSLNRPDVLNALSPNLIKELKAVAQEVAQDQEARIFILAGEGRAWSAGVDLKALRAGIEHGQFTQATVMQDGKDFIDCLQSMSQVCIAEVHGYCFTGALELMMAFDMVIAAEDTKIGDTHAKWGIAPKWGMTQRLARLIGRLKAMELSFTAKPISGTEAARIGLINQAVPATELRNTVDALCESILANSGQTIALMKDLYYKGWESDLKEGLEYEWTKESSLTDSADKLKSFEKHK